MESTTFVRLTGSLLTNAARGLHRRGSLARAHEARDRANREGRGGGRPKPPEKGAPGISGLRADLADGTLTVNQLQSMPLSQIARRYACSIEHAGRMKRKTLNAV
jgi:hypothetical protein